MRNGLILDVVVLAVFKFVPVTIILMENLKKDLHR